MDDFCSLPLMAETMIKAATDIDMQTYLYIRTKDHP